MVGEVSHDEQAAPPHLVRPCSGNVIGIVAERELTPTPLEATAFALGIHEDTGSLTYGTTRQRDVDALSAALHALAEDPALRHRLGEAARAKVAAEYDTLKQNEALEKHAQLQGKSIDFGSRVP